MVDKDAVKYTYDFADATNELASAMTNMNESMMVALSGSKTWTILSRITSGSGFWKIQNKIRAITDVFKVYDNVQKKAIENSDKFGKQMRSMATIMGKVPKNMNFDALKQVSEGNMVDTTKGKMYENVIQSETFQAIKTLFGNEKALSYAEEQITAQTEMLKQIQEKLQWQEDFAKGDIKTKATMIRDTVIKLATVYFGLASQMLRIFITVALPYILVGIGILIVAVPLIAIGIGIILDFMRFINDSIKIGTKHMDIISIQGMRLIDLIKIPLEYIVSIMKQIGLIVQLALTGELLRALYETFKLLIWTVFLQGIWMLIRWAGTFLGLTLKFIIGAVVGLGSMIVKGIVAAVKGIGKTLLFGGHGRAYASGGTSKGGMAMVGESGPEMVYLPNGARVVNSPSSRRGGGATINVYVTGRVRF